MKITIEVDDEKLRRSLRWMKRGLVLAVLAGAVVAAADNAGTLVTFVAGQPIRASELNGNFALLKGSLDAQQVAAGNLGDLQTANKTSLVAAINETLSRAESTLVAFLPGRSGGQVLHGGTGAGETLKLESTADATKGQVLLASEGGNVGVGVPSAGNALSVGGGLTVDAKGTGNAPIRFGSDTSGDTLGVDSSHNLSINLGGQNRLTLHPSTSAFVATGLDVGQVGVGVRPGRLHVGGTGAELSIADRAQTTFIDTPSHGERWSIYGQSGQLHFWSGSDAFSIKPNGDVTAGAYYGDGSHLNGVVHTAESVRIVRGFFGGATPTPITGNGYTVQHISDGVYRVNFSPAFADFPSVTASTYLDNAGAVYINQSNSCDPFSACDHVELHTTTGHDMNMVFIAIGK